MGTYQLKIGTTGLVWFLALLILLNWNWPVNAQSANESRNPVRTAKIGLARFDYYENPQAVAASATFYLSGSQTHSMVFDFVAVTVAFVTRGASLQKPSAVHFNFAVATYRDGCKIRDRYADKGLLRIALMADDESAFETDLTLTRASELKTRNGKMCMEVYAFQMPFDSLVTLASAGKASFILGPRSLGFQRKQLDALKVLVNGIGRY